MRSRHDKAPMPKHSDATMMPMMPMMGAHSGTMPATAQRKGEGKARKRNKNPPNKGR